MKPIAIIINQIDFRDEEYFIPKAIFEEAGIKVATISEKIGMCLGAFGGVTIADTALEKAKPSDFCFVVLTNSEAIKNIANSEKAKVLISEAKEQGIGVGFVESPVKARNFASALVDKLKQV